MRKCNCPLSHFTQTLNTNVWWLVLIHKWIFSSGIPYVLFLPWQNLWVVPCKLFLANPHWGMPSCYLYDVSLNRYVPLTLLYDSKRILAWDWRKYLIITYSSTFGTSSIWVVAALPNVQQWFLSAHEGQVPNSLLVATRELTTGAVTTLSCTVGAATIGIEAKGHLNHRSGNLYMLLLKANFSGYHVHPDHLILQEDTMCCFYELFLSMDNRNDSLSTYVNSQ